MNAFTSMLSKTATKIKVKGHKYGPTIAITTGLIGMGTALYFTYKATTKIEQDRRERNEELNLVEIYKENGQIDHEDGSVVPYTEEDAKRDTKIYNSRFWVNCVKHTAPAVGLFLLSSFLIVTGFKAKAKEAALLGTAVAGLTAQLADVRKELEAEVGKEKANDIFLGKHTHTETDISEDGEVTSREVTTTNTFVRGYTFEFSKASSPFLWTGVEKTDSDFITGCLNHSKYLLHEKHGHVTFNDILDEFEIPRVPYGFTDGSIESDGHELVFDIDYRTDENGQTYYIITPNLQGFIIDKI